MSKLHDAGIDAAADELKGLAADDVEIGNRLRGRLAWSACARPTLAAPRSRNAVFSAGSAGLLFGSTIARSGRQPDTAARTARGRPDVAS